MTDRKAQPQPVALFISDLHLHASLPNTTQAFFAFLRDHAKKAKQLYLLGDLFEYWAGDDDIANSYNQQVIDAIRAVSDAGVEVFWIAGNRDFLVGKDFAQATGSVLLPDPYITTIAGQRVVLTHGDALCTDDQSYMTFRAQVREEKWQQSFLEKPLAERKSIIEGLRIDSKQAQRNKPAEIMDVNATATENLFNTSETSIMIHGHTHRPARHECELDGKNLVRFVLPDWDCDVEPQRGGWLAIEADGRIRRFGIDGIAIN